MEAGGVNMNEGLRCRRVSAWEYDLILKEAEKYGELRHHFFVVVEGLFRDVYAVNESVWRVVEGMHLRDGLKIHSCGTLIGSIKLERSLERFRPHVSFFTFVDVLRNYVVLSPRTAFLFTTGKDAPKEGVRKISWKGTKTIVVYDEGGIVIGIGRVNPGSPKNFIINVSDVGKPLRRRRR